MYISPDSKSKMVADGVAVGHLLVANLCVILGSFSDVFKNYVQQPDTANTGLNFVYIYFDYPVYVFFKLIIGTLGSDPILSYVLAEVVIVLSSVLYGFVAFFVMRIYFSVSE